MISPARVALILGLLAVVLSVALKAAFDHWVTNRFVFWDDDMIGFGPYAWVYLSIGAIGTLALASGDIGVGRHIAGVLAFLFVAVMWFLVFDNAVGALRDGEISLAGLGIGLFAIAQVSVLSIWLAFAWRWARIRR
ncbi:MAG: hypothetical protein ACRDFR_04530 [Candidatus Limnocylindria bacterium]